MLKSDIFIFCPVLTFWPVRTNMESSSAPFVRLFALLIGINNYQAEEIDNLYGATGDAFAWRDLLTDYHVPEEQIRMLVNRKAHRSAILEALEEFKDDPRICVGDPIFIFFAGHGSELTAPPHWESGNCDSPIQMILPHDYCESPGKLNVPGIPDRTIGAILEDIAEKKGNNITVVLDCCHATSGTRGSNRRSGGRARSVRVKPSIHTQGLDYELLERVFKDRRPPSRFRFNGFGSHVLIAACRSWETARETAKGPAIGGRFSKALLKLLRKIPPNQLRYSELLNRMERIPNQHPQIEGANLDRYLFDAKVLPASPHHFLCRDVVLKSWVINAGAAHGITQGSEFVISSTGVVDVRPRPKIVVTHDIRAFSAAVQMVGHCPIHIAGPCPESCFSSEISYSLVQTRSGGEASLSIYIPSGPNQQIFSERLTSLLQGPMPKHSIHNIAFVEDPSLAHLELMHLDDSVITFRILWSKLTQYGPDLRKTSLDIKGPSSIDSFLGTLSQYFLELDRPNGDSTFMKDIRLSFCELEESKSLFEDVKRSEMRPKGANLFKDGEVNITVAEESYFGIKLENEGSFDIYPTLLYFDNVDFTTIVACYRSPCSGLYLTEPPLKKGGSLTLGYGSGGMAPLSFGLREDENVAVNFLKLVLSTHPLDSVTPPGPDFPEHWASIVIPVVQYRYSVSTPRTRMTDIWPQVRSPSKIGRTISTPGRFGLSH